MQSTFVMYSPTICVFLCCVMSVSCDQLDNPNQLSKSQFEQVFNSTTFPKAFHTFPHFSYIFTQISQSALEPTCFVSLIGFGNGLVHRECTNIEEYQENDEKISSLIFAYRCFKSDSPYDYDLHTAPISGIRREHGNLFIYFTPVPANNCKPIFLGDKTSDKKMLANYLKDRDLSETIIDDGDQLTKRQFEDAFQIKEVFETRPYFTYIFHRDLVMSTQLVPIRHCLVSMYEQGRGIVHPSCVEILGFFYHMDEKMRNLLLPYRCFPNQHNIGKYELHNTSITDIALESIAGEDGHYVVYFTPKESEHCKPIWKTDHDEDTWGYGRTREEL